MRRRNVPQGPAGWSSSEGVGAAVDAAAAGISIVGVSTACARRLTRFAITSAAKIASQIRSRGNSLDMRGAVPEVAEERERYRQKDDFFPEGNEPESRRSRETSGGESLAVRMLSTRGPFPEADRQRPRKCTETL